MSLLEQILKAEDLPKVGVEIPEWGLTKDQAFIRTMTGLERDAYEASNLKRDAEGTMQVSFENISARLVARCLVDAEGKRVIPDEKIGEFGRKSAAVLMRLFRVAQQVNGLTAQAVKDAEKN